MPSPAARTAWVWPDFSEAYAEQNLRDYTAFVAAIDDGRLECAEPEVS